jgi:rubrerythrin
MIHQKDIPRVVFSLSLLIQSNNKRASYYRAAAGRSSDIEMKTLFSGLAEQSEGFASDLTRWVKAYGATPAPAKKTAAVAAWEKLKNILMIDGSENLSAISGAMEEDTLKVYRTALTLSFLPGAAIRDVREHVNQFERARKRFMNLHTGMFQTVTTSQAAAA